MSEIKIRISDVLSMNKSLKSYYGKLKDVRQSLYSEMNSVDSEILARGNLNVRIRNAINELDDTEFKLKDIESFINYAMDNYNQAENRICMEAGRLGLISSEYDENDDSEELKKEIDDAWREQLISFGLLVPLAGLGNLNSNKLLITKNGLKFMMYKEDGKIFFKLTNGEVANQSDYLKYRNLLKEDMGGKWKWNKDFVTSLSDEGIPLYQDNDFIKGNAKKFMGTEFDGLDECIENLGRSKSQVLLGTAKETFAENMKPWECFQDIKGAATLTKVGKAAGAAGILLTAADDAFAEYSKNDGRTFVDKTADTVADVGVDLATGSAAMAAGAAFGSLILPPVGTVVGMAAGVAINTAINYKFGGPPKESAVDHIKDGAKQVVDSAVKTVENIVPKALSSIFW